MNSEGNLSNEVEWNERVDSSGIPVCREIPQEPATRKLTQRPRKAAPQWNSTFKTSLLHILNESSSERQKHAPESAALAKAEERLHGHV